MDLRAKQADGNPVLDLADILDLNEILIVRTENEYRAHRHAEKKSKRK